VDVFLVMIFMAITTILLLATKLYLEPDKERRKKRKKKKQIKGDIM